MRVFLTGFMGAGKSTVGRLLARSAGWPFVDIDRQIERRAGLGVGEIFERRGESGFRELERRELRRAARLPAAVVATGGGAPARPDNLETMRKAGVVVWLHPGFATMLVRLQADAGDRPLFRDLRQLRALYRQRLPAYRQADLEIRVRSDDRPEEIADRILRRLRRAPAGAAERAR